MYRYKIDSSFEKIPLEINIIKAPLNDKGFADLLSINLEYTYKLNRAKNRINDYSSTVWEEVKKHTNPYEFIYAFNTKHRGNDYRSVSLYKPLSRSFFKMIEIIYEFCAQIAVAGFNKGASALVAGFFKSCAQSNDAEFNKRTLVSVHIAEGPGGFIEAVRFVRKGKHDDHAFGMTLIDDKYNYNKGARGAEALDYNKGARGAEALDYNKGARGAEALDYNKGARGAEALDYNKGARGAEALDYNKGARGAEALDYNKGARGAEALDYNKGARGSSVQRAEPSRGLHPLVPGWKQSNHFLLNNPEVHIIYGADGTGDIYKPENILFLHNEMRKVCEEDIVEDKTTGSVGAHLITADGGFDFSVDYNYQEQSSCKLIFSQILGAIKCQRTGGTFICKFFDINLYFTVEMLYLLYSLYETVHIYKPYTSRIANSEKYIICSNFQGIDTDLCNSLFDVLNQWNAYTTETINHMFKEIPQLFIDRIKEINNEIVDAQINSINTAINIIKKQKYITNSNTYSGDMTVEKQIKYAKDWCKKYNIPYKY